MQFNPVYLYSNKLDVFTSPADVWSTERYRRVYNRNLKIYRGVDNRIDIQVRNPDQKTSNITGSTLVFNLVSKETKNLVLTKDFNDMDLSTGKVTIILTDEDLLNIDNGFYQYSIIKEIRENISDTEYRITSKIPLYVDTQYGTIGTLDVSGDVYGNVQESIVVSNFNYINPFATGSTDKPWYVSSIIDASPKIKNGDPLHTFQFYSTNYAGSVIIQGSLDDQGGTPRESSWTSITEVDLDIEQYKNVVGHWNWFRIKHIPTRNSNLAQFTIGQTLLMSYQVSIYSPGRGYTPGDTVTIPGSSLGGESPANDLIITVLTVNGAGGITNISWTGASYNGAKTFVLSGSTNEIGTLDKILYR